LAPPAKVIGIDLGTTNSCMAMIVDGQITVIPNREGEKTTPSVVSYLKNGDRLVGRLARRQAATNPHDTVFSAKRLMGMKHSDPSVQKDLSLMPFEVVKAENGDAWVLAGAKRMSPPEVAAQVLQKMKLDAEAYLGHDVKEAVITVPAYFSDAQRQATKDAGRIAGLDVLRILNEPTAAALSCGLEKRNNLTVAVYDLGGGTFDVTILQLKGGVFEVKATNGDTHLGGDDFDHVLIQMLVDGFKASDGINLAGDKLALQRLKEAAETAKIELSKQVQAEVNLPFIAQAPDGGGPRHLVTSITREAFNAATAALVQGTLKPCERALADAKLTRAQVDEVLLVGGMTRVPEVRRVVQEFFGRPPHPGVDPDEAVAVGASIQGGILKGEVRDKLLLDVTPLSLGVRVAGGLFSKLIEKNTTIPTRKTATYTTANDMQASVRISVYQGENPLAAENIFLGDFEMVNIPAAPRGTPQIEVSFDIDANGILRVRAQDKDTKQAQSIKIEPNSGLSEDQIAGMVEAVKQHAKVNEIQSLDEQFRLTCRKLVEESRRELAQNFAADGGLWLNEVEARLSGESGDGLKATLKELNQFLLKLRLPGAAPGPAEAAEAPESA
jgi:molecular chaperone DnaK